jgi:hypothetical protein
MQFAFHTRKRLLQPRLPLFSLHIYLYNIVLLFAYQLRKKKHQGGRKRYHYVTVNSIATTRHCAVAPSASRLSMPQAFLNNTNRPTMSHHCVAVNTAAL